MTRQEFQTNQIGKNLRITMGLDEPMEELLKQQDTTSRYACWRHLGEAGECIAAYRDADKEPIFLLQLHPTANRDNIITVDVHAKHTRPA